MEAVKRQPSFEEVYNAKLNASNFEINVSEKLKALFLKALRFASPMNSGCNASELRAAITKLQSEIPMTYYEYAVISNNAERLTANELDMPLFEYLDLMDEVEANVKHWNAGTENIRQNILQELAAKNLKPNSLQSVKN